MAKSAARTLIFIASPSLVHLEDWFRYWFPVRDPDVSFLYPWIRWEEDEAVLQDKATRAIAGAYDGNRIQRIAEKTISVIESLDQVLMIVDMDDPEAFKRVSIGRKVLMEAFDKVAPGITIMWIGIFLQRQNVGQLPPASHGSPPFGQFDKIFYLDSANMKHFSLEERDQGCLAGHLLYFLSTYPFKVPNPSQYREWLTRGDAGGGDVTGFSALSLVLPMDAVIETVAVVKGAEILRESLLKEKLPDRHKSYLENFLQKNFMVIYDEVRRAVSIDPAERLRDPVGTLPDFDSMRPEEYLEAMDLVDASLPGAALENGVVMERIVLRRLQECKESLVVHLETMVTDEPGGLPMAQKFLDELRERVASMIPKDIPPPIYGDPSIHMNALRNYLAKSPRREALYGRGAAMAAVSGTAAAFLPVAGVEKAILASVLPVMSFGIVGFASHASREQLRRHINHLHSVLRGKWNVLDEHEKAKAAKVFLEKFLQVLDEAKAEIVDSAVRVEEIARYFSETYSAPFPEELALWRYVVRDRMELLAFQQFCLMDVIRTASDYLKQDHPLFLWRRLSPKGSPSFNPWEIEIVEKAAIRALPGCNGILKKSILQCIDLSGEKFRGYMLSVRSVAPVFLLLKPGSKDLGDWAVLESVGEDSNPVIGKVVEALKEQFPRAERLQASDRYRVTFFGFQEGISPRDLLR